LRCHTFLSTESECELWEICLYSLRCIGVMDYNSNADERDAYSP
jgi:hypothetical protein